MNFLEANLEVLSDLAPGLGEKLESVEPENLEAVRTHSGLVTVLRKGVYLHSRFDPAKEAEKLLEAADSANSGTVIFYGFGLGYHIERFFFLHPDSRAIVVEPDAPFFRKALEFRDFTSLFRREGLKILVGTEPETLAAVLGEVEDDDVKIFRLRSVYTASEEYFRKTDAVVARITNRRDINLATLTRFGRLWVRNLAANLSLVGKSQGIEAISGVFADIPSLVVAAGPSLDDVLPRLAELREKFIVIAVDTSYNACLRFGVEPDFVVVVDPQYWNTRHLDRAVQTTTILISESSTHPRIFRLLPGRSYFCGSLFPLGKFLESTSAPKGTLGAGGSVSTSAWDFARVIGSGPIVMAGLDLGFPGKNTHFKGSFFEDRSFSVSCRTSPGETHSVAYLYDAGPSYLPSNDGGLTLTDRRMLVYQGWFEAQMVLHPEAKTLNLSRRGLRITGMEPVTSETLLSYPDRRSEIDSIISNLPSGCGQRAGTEHFASSIEELMEELDRLENICLEGRAVLAGANPSDGSGMERVLGSLDAVDERIRSLKHRDVAGFLLASVLRDLGTSPKDGSAALENSGKVYEALADSASYHRRLLRDALQKIQDFTPHADVSNGE